ncbi:large conductance mechanosensitive channel protein MscL [Streptomyces sp. NPDC059447]|uniref:large conductance mechanosensitive channel protein MscL n=1 Tax=unclassified Streptomyces TaxID=2593676 RepID=UPI00367C868E
MVGEKKKESVLAGFKAFLMRGNVVDLAVAVVIGAAFTNIVNSIVKGIISPVVGAVGTQSLEGYKTCIKEPCTIGPDGQPTGVQLLWGSVLNATLTFLITAAVVYFLMVLPMAKYLAKQEQRRKAREGVQETMEITELEVLKEIRDNLVAQRAGSNGSGAGVTPGSRDAF